MDPIIFAIAGGLFLLFVLIILFVGPDTAKSAKRRMAAIRDRYSTSNEAALAAQMRRTIAARLPGSQGALVNLIPNPDQLALRLRRTGKSWQLRNFALANVGIAAIIAIGTAAVGLNIALAVLIGVAAGFGLPHMFVGMLINKRVALFNARFPDAIDLLVRGLRSGLPVAETLQAAASEIPGPVGVEFKLVIERIKIGKSMDAALQETADVLDTPEFQFFCITLAIQRETGGNLAETLANLSEVLRKRAQMKLKIKAMSSEAKASAWIVGALPFLVFGLVTFMNPEYTAAFFPWSGEAYDERAMMAGVGGLVWMGIGVGIMAKMVSFEI
jgi:tight adherence protein B